MEFRGPDFIMLTETFQNNDPRKIIIRVSNISFIQEGYNGKDTHVSLNQINDEGKHKYFWVKETLGEIVKMLTVPVKS